MPRKRRRAYARQRVTWLSVFDLLADGGDNSYRREECLSFWRQQKDEIVALRDELWPDAPLWPEVEEQKVKGDFQHA